MGFVSRISSLIVMVVILIMMSSYCEAYKFYVGGRDGSWVVNPPEKYNNWAERTRFQVNDTIAFKYKNGSDSVLVVNRDDYFSCKISNPILSLTLTDGDSVFTFHRSGPFFFISGNPDNCNKGLKLIIVVLAIRPNPNPNPGPQSAPPSPSPSPSPSLAPAASPAPATQPPSAASPPAGSPGSGRAPADLDTPSPSPVGRVNSSASRVVLGFGLSVLVFTVGLVVGF